MAEDVLEEAAVRPAGGVAWHEWGLVAVYILATNTDSNARHRRHLPSVRVIAFSRKRVNRDSKNMGISLKAKNISTLHAEYL